MADETGAGGAEGAGQEKVKASAGNLSWLWMILALITVGGFLTWLGIESEPTSVSVMEAGGSEDFGGEVGVPVVSKDTLGANKTRFIGQRIQVHNIEATGSLGQRIFWGELGDRANQVPILVRMDSATAAGFRMQMGGLYSMTGSIYSMSDSLATAWAEAGELAGEGERMQAAFADMYFMIDRIRPTPAVLQESSGPGTSGTGPTSGDSAAAGNAN